MLWVSWSHDSLLWSLLLWGWRRSLTDWSGVGLGGAVGAGACPERQEAGTPAGSEV